jgi:hypothetical protein
MRFSLWLLQVQGAQTLRNEAQRRSWTFYEAVNLEQRTLNRERLQMGIIRNEEKDRN